MYVRHEFHRLVGTRTEAELLGEVWTGRTILSLSSSDSLDGVRGFYCRIEGLPKEASLYFYSKGCSVLLRAEGALCISIDCHNTAGSGHLELEVGIVWHHIESSECGLSKQCMITTAEGDDIED